MLKMVKDKLYFFKTWYNDVFLYPKHRISRQDSLDYDKYWRVKRGDKVGALSDWQKARAELIVKKLKSASPFSLGDIGCGEGSTLKYLKEKLAITRAVGYDSSDFVLDKARQIGIETVRIDINDIADLEKISTADYNLLLEVLEHTPNSEKLLSYVYNKSSKGLFFSFPNSGYFIYRLRLLFGRFPKQWINFPNEHLRFWTAKDLKWWLRAQDYNDFEIYYYKGSSLLNKIWPYMFAANPNLLSTAFRRMFGIKSIYR